jgi:hypothetical protein
MVRYRIELATIIELFAQAEGHRRRTADFMKLLPMARRDL